MSYATVLVDKSGGRGWDVGKGQDSLSLIVIDVKLAHAKEFFPSSCTSCLIVAFFQSKFTQLKVLTLL